MKIFEAYYDLKLRAGLKLYLLAEGRKISEIDRLYRQFGTYLSRIKGIPYFNVLLSCSTESEFQEKLDFLFNTLWKDHYEYKEMPKYFIRYLQYLHSAYALDPSINIEGLEMPDDFWCIPESDFTDYAKPYIKDGKLSIIANPLLIKKLLPYRQNWPLGCNEAVRVAKDFYHSLLPEMTDEDWKLKIEELLQPKKRSKAKATARNVLFSFPDASEKVLSGSDAMEFVINEIGIKRAMSLNVTHLKEKLVLREINKRYPSSYKALDNGLWLNMKGNTEDKVKTLRLLASLLRLPYVISITNKTPE